MHSTKSGICHDMFSCLPPVLVNATENTPLKIDIFTLINFIYFHQTCVYSVRNMNIFSG